MVARGAGQDDFDGDDVPVEGGGYTFEAMPPMFVNPATGCWIPLRRERTEKGYVRVSDGKGGMVRLHREMYARFYGDLKPSDLVRHTCDVRDCINPMHLLKGSHADNVQDMMNRGRVASGQRVGTAKLTDEQAIEIVTDDSLSVAEKAAKYNVTERTIRSVLLGLTFKKATAPYRESKRPDSSTN